MKEKNYEKEAERILSLPYEKAKTEIITLLKTIYNYQNRHKPHKTTPGTIYKPKNVNRIYIKYKNFRIPTGLRADIKHNWKIAAEMLEQIHYRYIHYDEIPQTKIPIQEAIQIFQEKYLINKSKKTKQTFKLTFKHIIGNTDFKLTPKQLENAAINFLKRAKHLSITSKRTYLRHFQTFAYWCYKNDLIPNAPNLIQYAPKPPKPTIETYTKEEIKKLLTHLKVNDRKMYYLVKFLLLTGLRISEALTLHWTQIDNTKILIANKTTKQTEVFPLTEAIKNLLKEIPREKQSTKVFPWSPSSTSTLLRRLKRHLYSIGIQPRKGFHTFRRTFREMLLQENTPLEVVQTLMRHSDIRTTLEHYTKINIDYLKNHLHNANKNLTKI